MVDIVSHGISYRGTSCVTVVDGHLRICLWLVSGLHSGLSVRGTDTTVPALAGRIARNRVADRRLLEVEGFVQGVGANEALRRSDFETAMQEVSALFDPTLAAGTLEVLLQDGSTASIAARTLPETIEGPPEIPSRRAVSFRLEALDPDWTFGGS